MTLSFRPSPVLVLLLVLAAPLVAAQRTPGSGDLLPSFTLPDQLGTLRKVEALYADKPLVLSFFARSCGPCKKELPILQRIHAAHGAKVLIAVVVLDPEGLRVFAPFRTEHGITFTILDGSGGAVQDLLAIDSIPRVFLVGRDGVIRESLLGFDSAKADEFEAKVLALADGR